MPGLDVDILEAERRVSFVLVSTHPVLNGAVPSMPYTDYIGGIHLKNTKPLPDDLEQFIKQSGQSGVIYVSFGTFVVADGMPGYAKQAIIEAFARIPQRVIWKFDENLPGLSPNVKLVKWTPQQDLLANPQIRALVTHGGLYSIMEALVNGVPLVGLPVIADQSANVMRAQELGIGVALSWNDVTADQLVSALNTVVNDSSYRENVLAHRRRFLDVPMAPLDKAVFWVEYTIRHAGSRHLRSAADQMNLIQYLLLDVLGCFLLALSAAVYVIYKIVQIAVRLVRKTNKPKKRKTKRS